MKAKELINSIKIGATVSVPDFKSEYIDTTYREMTTSDIESFGLRHYLKEFEEMHGDQDWCMTELCGNVYLLPSSRRWAKALLKKKDRELKERYGNTYSCKWA